MARSFNGSTDRIDYSNIQSVGVAQTIAFSVIPGSISQFQYYFCVHTSGDSGIGMLIWVSNDGSNGNVTFQHVTSSINIRRITSTLLSVSTPYRILCTWDGGFTASNIHIFIDGSEASYALSINGTGTLADTAGSWSIGGRIYDDNRNFNGVFSNFGWWNRVLDQGEIDADSAGRSPLTNRRGLKFAPPLIRHQRDPVSGQVGTLDGTTVANHPRTIFPRLRNSLLKAAAVTPAAFMTPNKGYW